MRIAVITCYHDPDYVRARVLRAALKTIPDVQVTVIKNSHKGMLRYPEVFWKLRQTLRNKKIDVCLLTFRGQEMLPAVLFLAKKRPVWFDELIVPIAYANQEHHAPSFKKRIYYFMARRSEPLYRRWLGRCKVIFADTQAHAELSARMSHSNLSKYVTIPVGTDESLIKHPEKKKSDDDVFRVFYWSTLVQPLHGIPTVLEAARKLGAQENIEIEIIGGNKKLRQAIDQAVADGARVTYNPWLPLPELVAAMERASLMLGGPFGNTLQAQHVITTKTYQGLAADMPVLIGDSLATREYFVDKDNALIVPQADTEALVKTIRWASKHPAELKQIAANGRKLYDRQFSTAAIAKILQPLTDAAS